MLPPSMQLPVFHAVILFIACLLASQISFESSSLLVYRSYPIHYRGVKVRDK